MFNLEKIFEISKKSMVAVLLDPTVLAATRIGLITVFLQKYNIQTEMIVDDEAITSAIPQRKESTIDL